jgi:hypothetical protein
MAFNLYVVYLTTLYSNSNCIASNERVISEELERMWKDAIVTIFKVLSRYLPEGTEERHEKPQSR